MYHSHQRTFRDCICSELMSRLFISCCSSPLLPSLRPPIPPPPSASPFDPARSIPPDKLHCPTELLRPRRGLGTLGGTAKSDFCCGGSDILGGNCGGGTGEIQCGQGSVVNERGLPSLPPPPPPLPADGCGFLLKLGKGPPGFPSPATPPRGPHDGNSVECEEFGKNPPTAGCGAYIPLGTDHLLWW